MNDLGLESIQEQGREAEPSLEDGIEKIDGESTSRRRRGGGVRTGSSGERFGGVLATEQDKVDEALIQPKFVIQYSFLR